MVTVQRGVEGDDEREYAVDMQKKDSWDGGK
jgi:hypothetical protein